MMWNSGTLVPVHSWGMPPCKEGTCANIIQSLNSCFYSPFSFSSRLLNFSAGVLGRKGRAISRCNPGAFRDPDSKSALREVKPAVLVVSLRSRSVGVRNQGRVWHCWAQLLSQERSAPDRGKGDPWCPQPGWTPQHPPTGQLFPAIYKKESFGIVVSFLRKNIFAALIIPERSKAVSKHSFL